MSSPMPAAAHAAVPEDDLPAAFRAFEKFERELGSPYDPDNIFSFRRAAETDEREEFPEAPVQHAFEAGWREHYIPAALGGRLRSFEELWLRLRALSRRDATLALIEFANLFGGVPIWVAGNPEQQAHAAAALRSGRRLSAAFHERAHGSDMACNELLAERDGAGWRLTGEKWCISGGSRSHVFVVYARTGALADPRGHSLLLVDKQDLPEGAWRPLPKLRTLGVRGADLSGLQLLQARVSAGALLGAEGGALEVMLRGFQLTRSLFTGLVLGLGDSALRLALEFTADRRLYGERVIALPYTRRLIADAFADLLVSECLGLAAVRTLDVATPQAALCSSVVKAYVPESIDQVVRTLFAALGARAFLRETFRWGAFQKIARDCPGMRVGHFNTAVSLSHLGVQLALIARQRRPGRARPAASASDTARVFDLNEPAVGFRAGALALTVRDRAELVDGLDEARARLDGLAGVEPAVAERLRVLTDVLLDERERQWREIGELARTRPGQSLPRAAELFDLARASATLHAGAAALQMWLGNRARLGEFFTRGEWLCLGLGRVATAFYRRPDPVPAEWVDALAGEAERRLRGDRLFSIVPAALAATPAEPPAEAPPGVL